MNKLTQEQINRLAMDSDEDSVPGKNPKEKQEDQNYQQQYENEVNQQINDEYEGQKYQQQIQESGNIHQLQQVASQIQEENVDQIIDEKHSRLDIESKYKNDEDLSLAKSQFIDSVKINNVTDKKVIAKPGLGANQKNNQAKNQKKVQKKKQPKEQKQLAKRPMKTPQALNKDSLVKQAKKQKLSQSQINRRLKEIKDSKEQMLRKKQEKQKKVEENRRKQYEQAKKLQEQRKQKNRLILQEQKLKKKAGAVGQNKNPVKEPEQQIKIPEKRSDFRYMDMAKQRKMQEKKIEKRIEQENKLKLKRLLQKPKGDLKGEAKKAAFMQQRKILKQREQKQRQLQSKQDEILIVKQTKQDINQAKKFIRQKNEQINRAEKTITDLTKALKQKQKKYYQTFSTKFNQQPEQYEQNNVSEATPIERFVHCFPQAKNPDQIFKLIDVDSDGVLSSQQIKAKLKEFSLDQDVISKIEELLDQNSDGTVSKQQFVFLIEMQLKKLKDFKEIMGIIQFNDPLQLEAKVVDMQAKIKFINAKIEEHNGKSKNQDYLQKIQKMEEKVRKLQSKWRKQTQSYKEGNKQIDTGPNSMAILANQAMKLKNEQKMKKAFIEKLRVKVKDNIQQKNKLLTSKVQQNLRLTQQVFKLQNEIQQRELRFLSLKKIQQNKKGYLERHSKQQKELEQAYKRTKQYQISISDPGKQAQIAAQKDQMRLLAAVLMIQRNYRRRKARGQFQKLKQQAR